MLAALLLLGPCARAQPPLELPGLTVVATREFLPPSDAELAAEAAVVEAEAYFRRVGLILKRHWILPGCVRRAGECRDEPARTVVRMSLDRHGNVLRTQRLSGSGKSSHDHAAERAIVKTRFLPPPPPSLGEPAIIDVGFTYTGVR